MIETVRHALKDLVLGDIGLGGVCMQAYRCNTFWNAMAIVRLLDLVERGATPCMVSMHGGYISGVDERLMQQFSETNVWIFSVLKVWTEVLVFKWSTATTIHFKCFPNSLTNPQEKTHFSATSFHHFCIARHLEISIPPFKPSDTYKPVEHCGDWNIRLAIGERKERQYGQDVNRERGW